MNLSAVELRKGDAERAATYIEDALTLPESLGDRARAEALWLLARVHYAKEDYRSAARIAKESVALFSTPRRLFQYGEYLVLATDGSQGFSTIETAIRREPRLFGLAAISSDLASYNDRVETLLASLVRESHSELWIAYEELLLQLPALSSLPLIATGPVAEAFRREIDGVGLSLERASYSELRGALAHTLELRKVLPAFQRLSAAEHALQSAIEQHRRAAEQLSAAEAALARCPDRPYDFGQFVLLGCLGVVGGVVIIAVVLVLFFDVHSKENMNLLPILWFLGVFGLPAFLIFRVIDGQKRRTECIRELHIAAELVRTADGLLAAATTERDSASSQAFVPGVK